MSKFSPSVTAVMAQTERNSRARAAYVTSVDGARCATLVQRVRSLERAPCLTGQESAHHTQGSLAQTLASSDRRHNKLAWKNRHCYDDRSRRGRGNTRNHLIPEWRIQIRLEPHEPWFLTDVGQCRVAILPWWAPKRPELACSPISHPTTDGNCAQPSASWQASNGVIGRAISSHDIKQHGDNKNDATRVF